jgi:hypothetical protein
METNTPKEKGDKNNTFGRICKHLPSISLQLQYYSLHLSLVISESDKPKFRIKLKWWVQVSHISPTSLQQNGQSRTWNLHHGIFSRYKRSILADRVPTFETTSVAGTETERIDCKTWLLESRSVIFIYLYLTLNINAVSVDWTWLTS